MASTPLLIGLTVRDSDGTDRANIQVTARNEATNQTQSLNTNTDAQVIFNLGDTKAFSKGWNIGDKVSVFSLFQGTVQQLRAYMRVKGHAGYGKVW